MELVENISSRREKLMEQLTPRREPNNPGVLNADHPLLEKFQASLKAHLLRVQHQLEQEIADIDHTLKTKSTERENLGAELYDLQQQIQHQRGTIDEILLKNKETREKRAKHDANVKILKSTYDELHRGFKGKKQQHNERLVELDNLHVLENNIDKWAKEIQDEVSVAKRAITKGSKDKIAIAEEKRKTEMFLYNLETELAKRENDLTLITDQIKEQEEMNQTLQQSLADANADLDILHKEHKRLMLAWNQVIVGVQQRDKALASLQSDFESEKQKQKVIESNIDGTKKSAQKEMTQNEKLVAFKTRIENDILILERQVNTDNVQLQKLFQELEKYNTILERTEADLKQSRNEGIFINTELKNIRAKLEKQVSAKVELEETILELLQEQITTDNAGQYRAKLLRETQDKRRYLEINLSSTENQLSGVLLELENYKGIIAKMKNELGISEIEKNNADKNFNHIIDEINATRNTINVKLRSTDVLNIQLHNLIKEAGGQELDPDELRALSLEKDIAELDAKIKETQNFWIRLQGHLVQLTEKRANQLNEFHISRTQLMVIDQKALKLDSELQKLKQEERETIRNLGKHNTHMDILCAKLFKTKKAHETIESQCEMTHNELTDKLKKSEIGILHLEAEISHLRDEILNLKHIVITKHQEALAWESKFKLTVQTKKYRDEEISQCSEIGCMKAEIHRMTVRYGQLKRAQEKLIQDLDNSIQHRDHIFDSATCREKISGNKSRTRHNIQQKLNETKNKLTQIQIEILGVEKTLTDVTQVEEKFLEEIEMHDREVANENISDKLIQTETEQGQLLKQENLENIVRKQRRVKRYKAVVAMKVAPKLKSEALIDQDIQRQREVHDHLMNIIEGLLNELPDYKFPISKIYQTLKED